MKYNLSQIMKSAWTIFRNTRAAGTAFSECLKRAWAVAKYRAAQITETVSKFVNGMSVTVEGYTRTLSRWTKGNYDRVYINGGSRAGDGFVDLKNRVACLRGELSYRTKIADMILAMEF